MKAIVTLAMNPAIDSIVAGVVLSLARGQTPRNAVRFGITAGAAAVMTPGTELCRSEDAERLHAKMRLKREGTGE